MTDKECGSGLVFILSGPSGAGKTTMALHAMENIPSIKQSLSCTTRPQRKGETDGVSYIFLNGEKFKQMIKDDAFIEYALVHDNYYGTPRESLENAKKGKYDLLLVIDVQGAMQIRDKGLAAVFIFIKPPSMNVLRQRLGNRGSEDTAKMERRLKIARKEIEKSVHYEHVIINDNLEKAKRELEEIISSERRKRRIGD